MVTIYRHPHDEGSIAIESLWSEKTLVQKVPGVLYDRHIKMWKCPLSWASCIALRGVFGSRLKVGDDIAEWAREEHTRRVKPALELRDLLEVESSPYTNEHDEYLYPFQKAGRDFLITSQEAVLGDEMGTGKTFQTIAALRAVEQKEGVDSAYPALVVCPNSVKYNWAREVGQWLPEATPIVVEGNATKRRSLIESAKDVERAVVIINYEATRRHSRLAPYGSTRLQRCFDCDSVRGIEGLKPAQCEVHTKELNGFGFRTCVLDEAHRVKDARVKQTRATWAVFHEDSVRYRWALTGTPVANHPGDFWSILHTVAPYEYPRKTAFLDRYAQMSFNAFGGMDITGLHPSTRSEFYQIVEPRFRRMLKQVVLPQLPDKIRTIRNIEMSPKQKKAYTEISKSLVTMLDDGTPMVSSNNLTAAIRLLQLSSAYCEIDKHGIDDDPSEWTVNLVGPSPKVDELIALIEENPEKPLAVSADQRKLLELASEELYKRDIDHVMITGAVPESVRNDNIQRFQAGDVNVIMYTYKAGGVGLNMARADTLVRLQRSWSLIDNQQGEDRVHRIGSEQHDSIHIIDLITSGTIEEHQVRRLYDKMERMEEITRDREQLAVRGLDTSSLEDELMRIESAFLGE